MPKFVIEREIPGAGDLSPEELRRISETSCGVLQQKGPRIQWLHSYVTSDKIYCVYIAPNEETIPRARPDRRLPCQSCLRDKIGYRSNHRGRMTHP